MSSTIEKKSVANVGLLTDLLVANLPAEGLRSVLRALVSLHPEINRDFNYRCKSYLQGQYAEIERSIDEKVASAEDILDTQKIVRAFIGCRLSFGSLLLMSRILRRCTAIFEKSFGDKERCALSVVDNDIAQALSQLSTTNLGAKELEVISDLSSSIDHLKVYYPFDRSQANLKLHYPQLGIPSAAVALGFSITCSQDTLKEIETWKIGGQEVPRIFCGLWQLSSSAWGSSSLQQTMSGFESYLRRGFTAFDMADIYGDVEVIFGEFRARLSNPQLLFTATKYCTFDSNANVFEQVQGFVTQRLQRLKSDRIDLLQLHWQDYCDPTYLEVLKILQADSRVAHVGLCNFDTEHTEAVLQEGIDISTTQVQFSLIDTRPTVKLAALCQKHDVKILAYGTLCGGFISEYWLGKPEPNVFSDHITPSQRKYYDMILSWGGWSLFQELLSTLSGISERQQVGISHVAMRWVLDRPYVGAVIVGCRIGISERADDNLAAYGWSLEQEDEAAIERVLAASRRTEMFREIGDCGSEHR